MTDPQQQDDLTAEADNLVQNTGNGQQPDDPTEQPSQDPDELPPGTETAARVAFDADGEEQQ